MIKYIIVHPEMGVYLGSALGLGFWSKLDDVDQPAAVAFDNKEDIIEYMSTWDSSVDNTEIIPVETNTDYIHKERIKEYW